MQSKTILRAMVFIIAFLSLTQTVLGQNHSGTYKGKTGTVEIQESQKSNVSTLRFRIQVVGSSIVPSVGDVDGEAQLVSPNLAEYKSSAEGQLCWLTFSFSGNRLKVTEKDCIAYHGASTSFGGIFERISQRSNLKSIDRDSVPQLSPSDRPTLLPDKYGDNRPTCSMTLEQAPAIRGFRLGMSIDEVLMPFYQEVRRSIIGTVEGRLKEGYSRFYGETKIVIPDSIMAFTDGVQPSRLYVNNPREFENVNRISFVFLDKRLYGVTIEYDITWQSLQQFADATSASLKLNGEWNQLYTPATGNYANLSCKGFDIQVGFQNTRYGETSSQSYVKLLDTSLDAEIEKRKEQERERIRKEAEEKERQEAEKRRVFRP